MEHNLIFTNVGFELKTSLKSQETSHEGRVVELLQIFVAKSLTKGSALLLQMSLVGGRAAAHWKKDWTKIISLGYKASVNSSDNHIRMMTF